MKKFFALLAITVGFATVSFAQTAATQEAKKECKSESGEVKACCKKGTTADAAAKPACHGSEKTASSEGAVKKECSKGGEAKACCKKEGATTAAAEGAAKKECSKEGEGKACCKKAGDAKTKE